MIYKHCLKEQRICKITGCDGVYSCKNLCAYHYSKERYNLLEKNRKYKLELKIKLMNSLGGVICTNLDCQVSGKCKDIRCLQIDHKNGDGYKDKQRFKSTTAMYLYYLKNLEEAKRNLQVLCANCNWIKRIDNHEHNTNWLS